MICYIVHCKGIPGDMKRTIPSVLEVDIEKVSALEDFGIILLPDGEFKAKIISPTFLSDGKSAAIYYSWELFSYKAQAILQAKQMVRSNFEFEYRKYKKPFTEDEVKNRIAEIKEVLL